MFSKIEKFKQNVIVVEANLNFETNYMYTWKIAKKTIIIFFFNEFNNEQKQQMRENYTFFQSEINVVTVLRNNVDV